ncbi:MAG: lysophospholipid acyltransferase family protein [Burkholderiaceae bacterium]
MIEIGSNAQPPLAASATRPASAPASTAPACDAAATGAQPQPEPARVRGRLAMLRDYVRLAGAMLRLVAMVAWVTISSWLRTRWMPVEQRAPYVRARATRLFSTYLAHVERAGLVELDLAAIESLRGQSSLVIAPNHPSLIDAFLVISRLPDLACIMKASVGSNLLFGLGARMCGYIRNDCTVTMVRASVEAVGEGRQLLIFPEGTRSVRQPIGPLTGAFSLIARRAGAPVQTVIIDTNTRFLGKGWPLWRLPEFPLRYRARLGPRFEPDEVVRRKDTLVDDVAQYMERALGGATDADASGHVHR